MPIIPHLNATENSVSEFNKITGMLQSFAVCPHTYSSFIFSSTHQFAPYKKWDLTF